jgi:very-short-patch-repair endonuclease
MTDAERRIWNHVRAHRLQGASFRRQVPIGAYIVDFFCPAARLIVEIDGGQHASEQRERDTHRDGWLRQQGYSVLRFWNNDVLENTDGVLDVIAAALARAATPLPSPPPHPNSGLPEFGQAYPWPKSDRSDFGWGRGPAAAGG